MEVEYAPPCRHQIVEARMPRSWMSSSRTGSPLPPLIMQEVAGVSPHSMPPWPGRRGESNSKNQQHQRRAKSRLLKKASPDPPTPPSHHHDGLTGSFTCGRPVLRRSTEAYSFHERGRTALLEMLVIRLLPCHSSCHRRRAARPPPTQMHQARPM
jgi:hypothetical protein